mmetsp:Transcript_58704/g.182044  ORF Transcript_58704/g.182044 Transcript_58704/m.182044 type:complete len:319 (-) Transcript_58704:296-1252(-)
MEGADIAVGAEPPWWQAQAALDIIDLERLAMHLHLPDELLLPRERQHAVRQPPRQRDREEWLRTHGKGAEETLVTLRRGDALDDVQQLPTLRGLIEDGRPGEASKGEVLRSEEKVPQAVKLLGILRLRSHQVVRLVHEHHLVAVHVGGALLKGNLHDRRVWPPALAQGAVGAARGGVADGAERGTRHQLAGVLPLEGNTVGLPDPSHVEEVFHLQDFTEGVAQAPGLLLCEVTQVPHVVPLLLPLRPAARDGCICGPFAAEVVTVAAGPSEQLHVEVPADGIFGEDGHLRPWVVEVIVQDADHLSRLAGTCGVVDEEP